VSSKEVIIEDLESSDEEEKKKKEEEKRKREAMLCSDVDEALKLMGGFGRHQWTIWFINMMCLFLGDFQLYPVAFFEKQPVY